MEVRLNAKSVIVLFYRWFVWYEDCQKFADRYLKNYTLRSTRD